MNREIKFRALLDGIWYYSDNHKQMEQLGCKLGHSVIGHFMSRFYGFETFTQYTGFKDQRNKRDIYDGDIYFEEVETDEGDEHLYLVCTWIAERGAFAWLSKGEYTNYVDNGFEAIDRDFEGFYFEMNQSDIGKLHYAGNIYEHSNLLS